jgi:tetratricopeptide (TPR) repeat protein
MPDSGEHDKAIADHTEAIRLDSQYANAYIGRGLNWDSKGEHDKAIADYNEAIRFDPQSADAYNNRGLTWTKIGEYDKAIADYTEAIRLDPQDARAYNNRGVAWKRKGNYYEAIANYTEAIRLDPESAIRYSTLAWLLATCPDGKYRDGAKAVQLAGKACELTDYTDANHLCWLAAAHAEAGNFDDAVAWQRKALDLASAGEKANMRMGLKLYEAGKPYHEK